MAHIGIAIPQSWSDPPSSIADLRSFICDAESGGLDSLWVQEQLIGKDPSFEPLATLAFAAALTHRIRLGSAGFVTPIRSILGFAKALATVDQLSLGRLEAGLVLGEMRSAFSAANVEWESRGRRFDDALDVIRSLWRNEFTNHSSPYGTYVDVTMTPKPVQHGGPPIWIGAKARPALERAARHADGWMGAGGASVAEWRQSLAVLGDMCTKVGRSHIRIGKKVYLWIDNDADIALDRLGRWFAAHWGVSDGVALARSVGVWGPPQRVAEALTALIEQGADTIVLNPVGDERSQLYAICDAVLPLIREAPQAR